jgi:hypothetical protein
MRVLAVAGVALMVSGTAAAVEFGTPLLDPSDARAYAAMAKTGWWDVCIEWGREYRKASDSKRTKLLTWYLTSERMLSSQDYAHVNDRTVDIGMTECGLFATKGAPSSANSTRTASGRRTQYVYSGSRNYIYTEPSPALDFSVGVVTAIQD